MPKEPLIPYGALNAPTNNDTQRKMSIEDDFFRVSVQKSVEEAYGAKVQKGGIWTAVVLRVDRFDDCMVTLKARVPEKDGTIPEPTEWIPAGVNSPSHRMIDMHRTYVGTSDTAPRIGQLIEVEIPLDNSPAKDGKLIKLLNEFVVDGIRSTISSAGAQKAANAPLEDATVPSVSGDAIGSGQRDPAAQIAATDASVMGPTDTSAGGSQGYDADMTAKYLEQSGGDADRAAEMAIADVEQQRMNYAVADTEIGQEGAHHDAAVTSITDMQPG